MQRTLFLCLGLVAVTWLEFEFFPGHTYLKGGTQIYVPVLERLDAPGYLSRDLVATNPNVTYTIYDEATLFLHEAARLEFKTALEAQQILCRAAAILGVFLIALATGLRDLPAFLVATLTNLGASLPGPAAFLVGPEGVPSALALGLVTLAIGLLAREKPLLAGLSGGVALVYHPATAGPFWLALVLIFIFDRNSRLLLRPCLIILFVFILLLANLAQLQPGIGRSAPLFAKLSPQLAELQHMRTGYVWVSSWVPTEIWHYLTLCVCGVWATVRTWTALSCLMRRLFLLLLSLGILSVPLSLLLLEGLGWSLIPQWQPARALLFTVLITSVACGIAAAKAGLRTRYREAFCWLVVVCAIPINARVLDLIPIRPTIGKADMHPAMKQTEPEMKATEQLADWARKNTWGSSTFLFPDADKAFYPGIFRALSKRAVWVDWKGGCALTKFEIAGRDWWERWQQTMQGGFSAQRLQTSLSLPIDYYVLQRTHSLLGVTPVFASRWFVVYDAGDLRNATGILRTSAKSRSDL